MIEFLSQTWHWAIAGTGIALIMFLLIFLGKHFGMSSNLRTLCSMTGVGKKVAFFNWDYKSQYWNLLVVVGAMIGGYVATHFLSNSSNVTLNPKTISQLETLHIQAPNGAIAPAELFSIEALQSPKVIVILLVGGILIGFGTRYAGGCTSGHAISGLSNLQLPSLKAVIGFFIGGLIMAHFILPKLLS